MTRHKRHVGMLNILAGLFVFLSGLMVCIDWVTDAASWEIGIKGPVWVVLGVVLALMGREYIDDARRE